VAAVIINERRKDGSVDTPWVAVLPGWRRRGVARALLQRNLRQLADHGVPKAVIRTVQENTNHTVALYEEAGYRVTARHPRYGKPL
jgi:ribosomal protein S18 acetylase RimI-like enzyme